MENIEKKEFLKNNYFFLINYTVIDNKQDYDIKWKKFIFPLIPKKLYKYQKLSDQNLNTLLQKKAWFAPPKNWEDTNDIRVRYDLDQFKKYIKENYNSFSIDLAKRIIDEEIFKDYHIDECKFKIVSDIFKKYINLNLSCNFPLLKTELKQYFNNSEINSIVNMIKEILKYIKNNKFKHEYINGLENLFDINKVRDNICCYCVTEHYDNIDMWKNYADDGNGYCIEYNLEIVNENETIFKCLFPMFYGEKEKINLFDIYSNLIKIQIGKGKIKDLFDDEMWKLVFSLFTKTLKYEYENEWRFIISNNDNKEGMLLDFDYISAIYLGDKISKAEKEKLLNFARCNNIVVYRRKVYGDNNFEYIKIN